MTALARWYGQQQQQQQQHDTRRAASRARYARVAEATPSLHPELYVGHDTVEGEIVCMVNPLI